MTYVEYTYCDQCSERKPEWSNYAGQGARAWVRIEFNDGNSHLDFCSFAHLDEYVKKHLLPKKEKEHE